MGGAIIDATAVHAGLTRRRVDTVVSPRSRCGRLALADNRWSSCGLASSSSACGEWDFYAPRMRSSKSARISAHLSPGPSPKVVMPRADDQFVHFRGEADIPW